MDQHRRPDNACLTHRAPKPDQPWRLADPGYRTCSSCYEQIHKLLSPLTVDDDGRPDGIPGLYLLLDARPGVTDSGRRGPGFGSRSPASDRILVMRDRRSKSCEIARDGVEYVWDPDADNGYPPLPLGVHGPERPPGAYVDKRDVWYGSDGKGYQEEETPARSVPRVLEAWVQLVAEEREVKPGAGTVADLCTWLDRHLDWLGRQEFVVDLADDLRRLHRQIKTASGAPRRSIGSCPNTIDEGDHTRTCGASLSAPLYGDTIECWACDRAWTRTEWLRLGDLLEAS